MIAIVNRTEEYGKGVYGVGMQMYTLQINSKILITFEHVYEDGLAVCLERAAIAAKQCEKNVRKRDEKYFRDLAEAIRRS